MLQFTNTTCYFNLKRVDTFVNPIYSLLALMHENEYWVGTTCRFVRSNLRWMFNVHTTTEDCVIQNCYDPQTTDVCFDDLSEVTSLVYLMTIGAYLSIHFYSIFLSSSIVRADVFMKAITFSCNFFTIFTHNEHSTNIPKLRIHLSNETTPSALKWTQQLCLIRI